MATIMENKDLNSHTNWQQGVDELESFDNTGASPVNADSWEKLERRLWPQPGKRKKNMYRIAAGLTGILMMIAVGSRWRQNEIVPAKYVNNQVITPADTTEKTIALSKKIEDASVSRAGQEPRGVNLTADKNKRKGKMIFDTAVKIPPFVVQSIQPDSFDQVRTNVLSQQPEKRPFKMQHINDITDNFETTPGVTIKHIPMRRYLNTVTGIDNGNAVAPAREHTLKKSSTIQN
ncbi:MAG: hypothetical protein H7258_02065 [Ferruginibacter sp.]|nr:hypothetical protein [Ferruginibacter sp.]